MHYKNLTIGLVTFKSEKVIFNCLKSIKNFKNIIILDNSNDKLLKNIVKKKYPHIKFILSKKNNGFGAGYNQIISQSNTKYFFLISPDTILRKNCVKNLVNVAEKLNGNFSIIAPQSNDVNYGYFSKNELSKTKFKNNFLKVDYVKGFAMFLNLNKFKKKKIFDDNIFLYLEDIDLCKTVKKNFGNIFVINNAYIKHLSAKSSNIGFEYEKCRNWHWMWSKTYYSFKHDSFIYTLFFSLISSFKNLLLSFFMKIISAKKSKIYYLRASGCFNALIRKKSWYRPNLMSRKFY